MSISNGAVIKKNDNTMSTPKDPSSFRPLFSTISPNQGAEMLRYGWTKPGIISLAQGEGSLKTPDFISEAAVKALHEGKTFYNNTLGTPEFRQEVATYYATHYGLNMPTNRIYATSSGTTAMHLAMTSILEEGDEVVAITPIWKNLLGAIEITQAKCVQVALDHTDAGWTLDLDKLFDAVTNKTKALLIVTPSNPTGWTMKGPEIKQVLEFARARGIWIISDEVYARTMYDVKRSTSFLDHAKPDDRLFVVNSFSKSYAMTGWRLGWLVGPADAEPAVRDIALYNNMGPPTFAQYAAIAALRHGESFIAEQMALWKSNLDLVMDRFNTNGRITMIRPESAFYAFFKVDGEPDCLSLTKRLIDEAGLSLAPGCAFGKVSEGWVRMCFAVSEQRITEALNRLELVVKPN
ncbi:MAG: beta-eliminating lyase [Micavibrio aeruginosavorus]|uniref:Aminotransferase n=1 Tax=Micavibrio aeruginosavorus TaxID=349221 RepID=A0A2W5N461_9BACT|nr:MAG: beta-eliminating lyase [Micavibrio aeruginosavorus]